MCSEVVIHTINILHYANLLQVVCTQWVHDFILINCGGLMHGYLRYRW